MIRAGTALIIFGKIHFLLISENEFFHEIKRDGITSFHGIHDKHSWLIHVWLLQQEIQEMGTMIPH